MFIFLFFVKNHTFFTPSCNPSNIFVSITVTNNLEGKTLSFTEPHRTIIDACMRGERQAQFELYQLYSKAMYNICKRMLKNDSDAEDVLQNAFIDIFTKLDSFGFQSTIGAWMKRIVINNCINFIQRKKFNFDEFDHQSHGREMIDYGDDDSMVGLTVDRVQKALSQLSDGYRVVFSLYMFEGYDHEEIASILQISESTSKSQYHRAKQKLREILV
jgi:RNA polymerase sigma factor (sigma-70 family)